MTLLETITTNEQPNHELIQYFANQTNTPVHAIVEKNNTQALKVRGFAKFKDFFRSKKPINLFQFLVPLRRQCQFYNIEYKPKNSNTSGYSKRLHRSCAYATR